MAGAQLTVADVLNKGIQREIESQRLYSDLRSRVRDDQTKYAFSMLFQQEQRHQQILQQYLSGGFKEGALQIGQVIDYRIAEYLDQPQIKPDMKLPDIFLLAAKREKTANEFYLSLAAVHPAGEIRQLLEKLASEELGHKKTVESLYSEVAFPQTDGG